MGKIIIYVDGRQIEVDEEQVSIYEPPFPSEEEKDKQKSS